MSKKKETSKPETKNINKQIDLLKEVKKKIIEQLNAIYNEQNNAWYEYEEQQKLIKYIKDVTAKINELKNVKKKKRKEKEVKKNKNPDEKKLEIPNLYAINKNQKSKMLKFEIVKK